MGNSQKGGLVNYIVFDLEWNQGGENEDQLLDSIPFEIIEIGAVKLNEKKEVIDRYERLIKPVVYHKMHYIAKKMLGLTMEDLEKEDSFVDILPDFLNWCGKDYIFCSWGPLDLIELQRNMRYHHLPELSDGPLRYLDIQKLFSYQFEDKKLRRSLEYAVNYLEIDETLAFHRAYDDAYYTGLVFQKINEKAVLDHVSFDCFSLPKDKKSEIHIEFDDYSKYISREFEDRIEAMADKEVTSTKCICCKKNLRKKMRWFSPNGKYYVAVSYCQEHGLMKSKIRLKKSEQGKTYVIKTSRQIDEEDFQAIREKQEHVKQLKKAKKNV